MTNGGSLFIVLCRKKEFGIYTGKKDVSGTGKNQKVTHHVTLMSNYDLIPFESIEYHSAIGKKVYSKNPVYTNIFNQFKDIFSYKTHLVSEKISKPTFTTKRGDKILGTSLKVKDGHLVYLPEVTFDIEKYVGYDSERDREFWNEEGLKQGVIFLNCLAQIDKSLRSRNAKSSKPEWLNNTKFELQEALKTKELISKNEKEIDLRIEENKKLNSALEEQEVLKDLLYETGKPLELAVIKALKILGYQAENYDDGKLELDQIIKSPEGDRFIGECEGKERKAIDVSKFRQLLDGLNADFEREEVTEKAYGLLFGNPQRQILPDQRNFDFTQKCKNGAEREGIGLIKTTDLFTVCKYVQENDAVEYAAKCRAAIKNQLGNVIVFPEVQ